MPVKTLFVRVSFTLKIKKSYDVKIFCRFGTGPIKPF